jgi:CBS domain-containing protein
MRVRDAMTHPTTVDAGAPIRRAAALLRDSGGADPRRPRYRWPLPRHDRPGRPAGAQADLHPVSEVMQTDVLVAHPDEGVWDLILILRLAGLCEVPVVEDGRVVGMIGRHDLLRARDRDRDDDAVARDVLQRLRRRMGRRRGRGPGHPPAGRPAGG